MIVAFCLLVLAGLANTAPVEVLTPCAAHFLRQVHAVPRADPPLSELYDGVPVSLAVQNDGAADDRFVGANSRLARSAELHRASLVHGRRETAPLSEGIAIPTNVASTLEPGKNYLSLDGLRMDLVQGDPSLIMLRFERACQVTVTARVLRRVDAAGSCALPAASFGALTVRFPSAPPAAAP